MLRRHFSLLTRRVHRQRNDPLPPNTGPPPRAMKNNCFSLIMDWRLEINSFMRVERPSIANDFVRMPIPSSICSPPKTDFFRIACDEQNLDRGDRCDPAQRGDDIRVPDVSPWTMWLTPARQRSAPGLSSPCVSEMMPILKVIDQGTVRLAYGAG